MINEKRSFSEAVLEEAQGITFDVVDACEEMSCGEGRLCELHEPLFLETCLILEDSKRLKAVNEALLKAAKTALAIHDRYCDRVGAADSWAHDVRSQLEDAIDLAETKL